MLYKPLLLYIRIPKPFTQVVSPLSYYQTFYSQTQFSTILRATTRFFKPVSGTKLT